MVVPARCVHSKLLGHEACTNSALPRSETFAPAALDSPVVLPCDGRLE